MRQWVLSVVFLFVALSASAETNLLAENELVQAARDNESKRVEEILARGGFPDAVDSRGRTALIVAAYGAVWVSLAINVAADHRSCCSAMALCQLRSGTLSSTKESAQMPRSVTAIKASPNGVW